MVFLSPTWWCPWVLSELTPFLREWKVLLSLPHITRSQRQRAFPRQACRSQSEALSILPLGGLRLAFPHETYSVLNRKAQTITMPSKDKVFSMLCYDSDPHRDVIVSLRRLFSESQIAAICGVFTLTLRFRPLGILLEWSTGIYICCSPMPPARGARDEPVLSWDVPPRGRGKTTHSGRYHWERACDNREGPLTPRRAWTTVPSSGTHGATRSIPTRSSWSSHCF